MRGAYVPDMHVISGTVPYRPDQDMYVWCVWSAPGSDPHVHEWKPICLSVSCYDMDTHMYLYTYKWKRSFNLILTWIGTYCISAYDTTSQTKKSSLYLTIWNEKRDKNQVIIVDILL